MDRTAYKNRHIKEHYDRIKKASVPCIVWAVAHS